MKGLNYVCMYHFYDPPVSELFLKGRKIQMQNIPGRVNTITIVLTTVIDTVLIWLQTHNT